MYCELPNVRVHKVLAVLLLILPWALPRNALAQFTFTTINFPPNLTSIGARAFNGCRLTTVFIPQSVSNIGIQAFIKCSGVRNVWVGKGVVNIGDAAFLGCVNLAGMYFTGNAPSVGSSVFGYSSVTVYYLPQTTGWGPTLGGWPANPTARLTAAKAVWPIVQFTV